MAAEEKMGKRRQSKWHTPLSERIEFHSIPEPNSGCWLWTGRVSARYGYIGIKGRSVRAHRAAYEVFNGPIGSGMCVCHKCDIPTCVNPQHLFLGTRKDNTADMMRKGRNRGVTWKGDFHG